MYLPEWHHGIFLARYNPDGTLAWAKGIGGEIKKDNDSSNDVATLKDGSSLITGFFFNVLTFDEGEENEITLTSGDSGYYSSAIDIFVAKFNPDGTIAWAKSAGGDYWNSGNSISALPDGSVLITGHIMGSATFGEGEENETEL